jgi:hypothetical protein
MRAEISRRVVAVPGGADSAMDRPGGAQESARWLWHARELGRAARVSTDVDGTSRHRET